MMRKIIYAFIGVIVFFTIAAILLFNKMTTENTNSKINETTNNEYEGSYYSDKYLENNFGVKNMTFEEKEQMIYYDNHMFEMLIKMMQKGNDWRCFPIQKSIKDRFNEKDGALAEYNFDSIVYSDETLNDLEEYGSVGRISIIGTNGKQKKQVYITVSFNDGLEKFEIEKNVDLTDENGKELDTRLICNKKNWDEIIWFLLESDDMTKNSVATTDNFRKKYDSLEDAISKKLNENGYSVGYETSDFENKSVDYYWKSSGGKKLIRVKFIIDDKGYIDDIEVKSIEQ